MIPAKGLEWMTDQEQALQAKGIRLTWRRRAILDIFRALGGHLSADDILVALRERKAKTDRTTVYRNLELLAALGVLRHVDFHDGCCRYELQSQACHHHLHCTRCGKTVEFGGCEIGELERRLAQRTNFVIERHHLEIFGLCPDCR